METAYVKKKWQNLIHKKCIICDGNLQEVPGRKHLLQCEHTLSGACNFYIKKHSIFDILSDERHVMRMFLTFGEREKLERAIEEAYSAIEL